MSWTALREKDVEFHIKDKMAIVSDAILEAAVWLREAVKQN